MKRPLAADEVHLTLPAAAFPELRKAARAGEGGAVAEKARRWAPAARSRRP